MFLSGAEKLFFCRIATRESIREPRDGGGPEATTSSYNIADNNTVSNRRLYKPSFLYLQLSTVSSMEGTST